MKSAKRLMNLALYLALLGVTLDRLCRGAGGID